MQNMCLIDMFVHFAWKKLYPGMGCNPVIDMDLTVLAGPFCFVIS